MVRGRLLRGSSGVEEDMRGCAKIGVYSDVNRGYWGGSKWRTLDVGVLA